jgi:predicted transcriptional regulator
MFAGAFIGGLWMLLIGLFLRNAAQLSYQQLLMRQTLKGERVGKFMKRNPVTVIASLSLKDFVEDYVYKYHYKMFPVVNDGKVLGCVTTREVKDIPSHEWDSRQIKDIMKNCSTANTVTPNTEAIKALSIMSKANSSRLMVVNGEDLEGIITLKDLLSFFALKLDLEGDQSVGDPFRTE